MGKILVFIFDGMVDYEITFIMHLLNTCGDFEIVTIAYEDKLIQCRSGALIKPSRIVSDVLNKDAEGIIITGGWYGETKPELLELIQGMHSNGKLVGGICGAGPVFLAKAGVLDHVKYTTAADQWTPQHMTVFGEKDPFPRENYLSQRVVRDGNVITAIGIAFIDFAVEICDWFKWFESAEDKAEFAGYYKGL
jgi:putative intracellular protease/amidase